MLVSPNLTNLLQPLDSAINRSYQEYYLSKYEHNTSRALWNPLLQNKNKAGNSEVPRYDAVAQWTLAWVISKDVADIKKLFRMFGLVAKENFKMDKLHPPLKAILSHDFDMNAWHAAYQHLLNDKSERDLLRVSTPDWYIPAKER